MILSKKEKKIIKYLRKKDVKLYKEGDKYKEDSTNTNLDTLYSWWNADVSILETLEKKLTQIFFNLKKFNNTCYCYLNYKDLVMFGTEEDKIWYKNKLAKSIENFEDFTINNDKICSQHFVYFVEDGFYKLEHCFDKIKFEQKWVLSSFINKEKKIIGTSYKFSFEEVLNDFKEFDLSLPRTPDSIINVSEKDYPLISKELKECLDGKRENLKIILKLRKIIKKLINLNEDDFNYWYDFENNTVKPEYVDTVEDERKKAYLLYKEERKKLYNDFANLMAEKGELFWD